MSDVEKQMHELLEKHGLTISYELDFPMYKQLPDEIQLALLVLKRHGMKVVFTLKEKTKQ